MDTHHHLLLDQQSLFEKSGYALMTPSSPLMECLDLQLGMAIHYGQRQQRPQTFSVVADTHLETFGKMFLTFHYCYDPAADTLAVNSIDAFMGEASRRFIPLKKDELPAPTAIATYLSNVKKLKARDWAKEYKAMPMHMLPGTHKRRR